MLIGVSTMLAMRTGEEAFAISEDEMGHFLKAAQNVARHYSVETTQKTLDWIAFVGVTGQVFGTRAVAISVKSRERKKGRNRPAPSVVQFPAPMTIDPGNVDDGSFAG